MNIQVGDKVINRFNSKLGTVIRLDKVYSPFASTNGTIRCLVEFEDGTTRNDPITAFIEPDKYVKPVYDPTGGINDEPRKDEMDKLTFDEEEPKPKKTKKKVDPKENAEQF